MEKDVELMEKEEMGISRQEREMRKVILKQAKDIQSIKWYLRFFVILTVLAFVGGLSILSAIVYKIMQ